MKKILFLIYLLYNLSCVNKRNSSYRSVPFNEEDAELLVRSKLDTINNVYGAYIIRKNNDNERQSTKNILNKLVLIGKNSISIGTLRPFTIDTLKTFSIIIDTATLFNPCKTKESLDRILEKKDSVTIVMPPFSSDKYYIVFLTLNKKRVFDLYPYECQKGLLKINPCIICDIFNMAIME